MSANSIEVDEEEFYGHPLLWMEPMKVKNDVVVPDVRADTRQGANSFVTLSGEQTLPNLNSDCLDYNGLRSPVELKPNKAEHIWSEPPGELEPSNKF